MINTILNTETNIFVHPELLTKYQDEGYTILHCETYQGLKDIPGGIVNVRWTTVSKTTSLFHRQTKGRLHILHAINIPIDPQKYWFKYSGERLAFTLIYPKIPSDWHYFDFVSDTNSITEVPSGHVVTGWLIRNIKRNDTGVYKLKLS